MVAAVAYIRLSKVDEDSPAHGLWAQRRAIDEAARHRGWSLEYFTERGVSAVARRRPELERALHLVEELARRDVRQTYVSPPALVVAKLDRLARNLWDYAQLVDRARRNGWQLVALDAPDASTPAGEAMQGMVAIFAQLERRLIAARTRESLAAARARGVRLGRPPAIAPAQQRRVIRRYRAGWSAKAIARDLDISDDAVRSFLRRRGVELRRGRPSRRTRLR